MENPIRPQPFSYTVDLTKVFLSAVFGLAVLGFVYVVATYQPRPQVSQPSVPSLIAPACDGRCNPARVSSRPFVVVCPYCRNTLSVQPSATGSVGQAVGEATAKVAK